MRTISASADSDAARSSSGFAERFCGLVALLELAPKDGLLFLLGERPSRLYLGVLERGAEHTQGADAGPVALLHGVLGVALYAVHYRHGIPSLPPMTCRWRWKTSCPASRPLLILTAVRL